MMMLSGNGNAAATIDDSAAGQHAGEIPDATSGLRQRALVAPVATIDQFSTHSPVLQHSTSSLLTGDDTLVSGATAASSATTASCAFVNCRPYDEVELYKMSRKFSFRRKTQLRKKTLKLASDNLLWV